ncbi:MAG: VWA domain-containing protein [Verrucomicrobia bacterium]|nr:VWA domain-containing protein [Verrucomicrobiota bacterium]
METTSLTFGAPDWFWLLAAIPLAAILFLWSHRRGRELVSKIVAPRLREQLAGSVSPLRRTVRAALMLTALVFAALALAQPRYGFIEKETKQKGRDVIVAIDTSRSMMATDVSPTRLARAKLFTQDLVRLMQGDRVGLIAFAGSAFLQAPLTLDYSAVTNSLDELDTDLIPVGGTNLAAAINAALEAFGKAEGNTRALVVLTDGEELDADGIAAAKRAAQEGIRIFTVGIGSPEGSLIPIRLDDGQPDFVRDKAGKPVTSKLDESRLREIAAATGGFFIPIGPEAARDIFEKGIVPMELSENGVFNARQPIERYQWPLAVATILLALSLLPGDRRRRLAKTSAVLLAFLPNAQAQTGMEEFNNGQFDKAGAVFENKLQSQPGSHELQFNAGAAAYKTGDHEKAATYFTEALLSSNPKLREAAAYNLANTLVRKGEAAAEPEAKKTNWKNAIEQYDEALQLNPDNNFAKENRELVKKLIEDLEKQQQQQEQKQDQKQDQQQQQDQEKKDEQKKDQQQQQPQDHQQNQEQKPEEQDKKDSQQKEQDGQQGQQDQQEKEGKEPKDDEQKNKDKPKEQSGQPEQKPDSEKKKQPQAHPQASPTPGDKKKGDIKSSNEQPQPTPTPASDAQGVPAQAEEEQEGQISPSQARALLNALRGEEEKVNLMETQQSSQDVLRDW